MWLLGILLFSLSLNAAVSQIYASHLTRREVFSYSGDEGIQVLFNDVELYFNASNGGEITEYYDLSVDPNRSRNLVNLAWKPYCQLLPLFTSLFYKPGYPDLVFSTGGDAEARLWLLTNTSTYVILQSSSRIISQAGQVAKDASGNPIYVKSTWVVRHNGLVSVERTFYVPTHVTIPSGWRWYPFYVTRRAGFTPKAIFYMFNTTYGYAAVVNETTYKDIFSVFSILPEDTGDVFGVAFPFANASLGGDGAHNILLAYKYDELVSVNEWRADNYHNNKRNVTEGGAVHEFSEAMQVSSHTYHAVLNFTHQPIDEESVQSFAGYYANNTEMALLMECSVTTNKDVYKPEDGYAFYGSGLAYYNLTGLKGRFTVKDSSSWIVYKQDYGPANITAGQAFNVTLLEGTVGLDALPGNYTASFQIFSPFGIVIASTSKMITVTES